MSDNATPPDPGDIQAMVNAAVAQAVAKALANAQEHGKDVDDSHTTLWQRNEDRREADRERFNTQREEKKEDARQKRKTQQQPEQTRGRHPTRHHEGRTVESKQGGWPFGIPQQPPPPPPDGSGTPIPFYCWSNGVASTITLSLLGGPTAIT